VTFDVEEYVPAHQARLVECDDAVAVGEIADVVDGPQLDKRHAATGLVIDNLYSEVCLRRGESIINRRDRRERRAGKKEKNTSP